MMTLAGILATLGLIAISAFEINSLPKSSVPYTQASVGIYEAVDNLGLQQAVIFEGKNWTCNGRYYTVLGKKTGRNEKITACCDWLGKCEVKR